MGVIAHHVVVDLAGGVGGQLVAAFKEKLLLFHYRSPPFTRFRGRSLSLVTQELAPTSS